ncbi:MAG: putative toxin-antitoxin system toxin component, PIN family [Verrucomicrobia bacterium]|nr:putative toxin-antitoxin system toxin component, PIN family [Verrucomicrobiota bacterium]
MNLTVIDTGVFVAGVFWRSEPHRRLKAWLNGLLCPVVSDDIFAEYERLLHEVKVEEGFDTDVESWLDTTRSSALWVTPVKFDEPVCRDPKDDKFIEAALVAGARTLIARDPDLTVLHKPFGIEILTPRAWLSRLPRGQRRLLDGTIGANGETVRLFLLSREGTQRPQRISTADCR